MEFMISVNFSHKNVGSWYFKKLVFKCERRYMNQTYIKSRHIEVCDATLEYDLHSVHDFVASLVAR